MKLGDTQPSQRAYAEQRHQSSTRQRIMTSPSSLFSIVNKNILITGGSRGIGLMLARGLSEAGANVLITSRSESACEEAAKSIQCHHIASNVSTREGCEALASHTRDVFGEKLHVLINNAGCSWGEEAYERESGKMNWGWDKVLDLNVKSIFYLTRACVPLLRGEDNIDPGRVINVGSVAGLMPQEAPTHAYDVSKAAVHHLTKKMSADLAPMNITVNCLAPGYVPTKMSAGLGMYVSMDTVTKKIPLKRMGEQDDMVGACVYFASRAGSYCTGVVLNVDGGTIGAAQIPLASL